ncbi:MAG: ATP synthase F1 subunit delta [Bacteroidota bacterium]
MIVANRYAKSLIELAQESNQVDAVRNDMKLIQQVCDQNREFNLFLKSPIIKTDKKMEVLNKLFASKISKTVMSFLNLITAKHRESIIEEITKAFEEQYKINNNIFTAVVTSASGLDAKTKEKVIALLKTQMKGEIELIEKVDSKTIGGFTLTIGDIQIDKTVARQLSNMKKQLTNKALN